MVCLGNICRSPLAEGILKGKIKKAGLNWEVDSAGTNGYHVGEPPHEFSQKVAIMKGTDISGQQCRLFVREDFDRFDKIYAMAADVVEDMQMIGKDKYNEAKSEVENAIAWNLWLWEDGYIHRQFEYNFPIINVKIKEII